MSGRAAVWSIVAAGLLASCGHDDRPVAGAVLLPELLDGNEVDLAAGTDGAYGPWAPGVWALFAAPDAHLDQPHVIVSCREVVDADRTSVGPSFGDPVVWEAVTGGWPPGVDVVRHIDLASGSMHIGFNDSGSRIVTVVDSDGPERAAQVAAELTSAADTLGCEAGLDVAAGLLPYPERHRRRLDAPIAPFGLRLVSWDGYTLVQGPADDDGTTPLYGFISVEVGDDPLPEGLIEFFVPSDDDLIWSVRDGRKTLTATSDDRESRSWVDGRWLRSAYRIEGSSSELDELIESLHVADDDEWAALVAAGRP
jgi:hypothetical protein